MNEIERRSDGTFAPGVSGNPGGRPRRLPATTAEITELAASFTTDVVVKLAEVVAVMPPGKPSMAGLKAAELLLAYGHGLPDRQKPSDGENGPIRIKFQMREGDVIDGEAEEDADA